MQTRLRISLNNRESLCSNWLELDREKLEKVIVSRIQDTGRLGCLTVVCGGITHFIPLLSIAYIYAEERKNDSKKQEEVPAVPVEM